MYIYKTDHLNAIILLIFETTATVRLIVLKSINILHNRVASKNKENFLPKRNNP